MVQRALAVRSALDPLGITPRLLGGVAIFRRCPSARDESKLARTYGDVDIAAHRTTAKSALEILAPLGLEPAEPFNRLHGGSRLKFWFEDGKHLDLFLGRFSMCHKLDFGPRLECDPETLSLADLLLTKLQIARLTPRDFGDVCALLADHALSADDSGINVQYIAALLGRDWGWWRTATENLDRVGARVADVSLPATERERVLRAVGDLHRWIAARPRSLQWRIRAKVGERLPWRDEPEEVDGTARLNPATPSNAP
jgi:hypothetical protein